MLNRSLVVLVALLLLAPAVLANIDNAGYIEANLDSVTSSYTPHNWGNLPNPPRYYLMNAVETANNNCLITVGFRVRDDSRLAGYSNKVEGTLQYFDFGARTWKDNNTSGNTFTKTGPNEKWGKHNNFENHSWTLAQPYPVTKYSLGLVADTKGIPTKRVWKEFYVAKQFPLQPGTTTYDGDKSDAVRRATPAWYAERMEIAQMLRRLKTEWDQMTQTNRATINFNDEMRAILQSAASLAGPTTPSEYFQNSGLEVLSLVSSVFAPAAMSTMIAAGGEIYECYQMLKWCTDTLNSSINTFNAQMSGLTMQNAVAAANRASNPSGYFETAANAVEAEANELIRIVYTDPWGSTDTWKSLLGTERDAFNSLAVSLTSARGTDSGVGAYGYCTSAGATATKATLTTYLDVAWKLAIKEYNLLVKATQ
jgi:hypothetical protein